MLRNDLHATDSIDHKFMKDMILVDEESKNLLYEGIPKVSKDVCKHELFEFAQKFKGSNDLDTIKNILKFTSNMALTYDINFLDMKFGGR